MGSLRNILLLGTVALAPVLVDLQQAAAESAELVLEGTVSTFRRRPRFRAAAITVEEHDERWRSLVAGEFTGDGCWDLLTSDEGSGEVRLRRSDCRGSFERGVPVGIPSLRPRELLLAGQIDGKGCADVVVLGKRWKLWRSRCEHGFEQWKSVRARGRTPAGGTTLVRAAVPFAARMLAVSQDQGSSFKKYRLLGNIRDVPGQTVDASPYDTVFKGFADVDGDGLDDPLFWGVRIRELRAMLDAAGSRPPWRASFAKGNRWRVFYSGDFNGDGLSDVLANLEGVEGWWLAQSTGATGIESPVNVPLPGAVDDELRVVLDRDGDGAFELLSCGAAPGGSCVAVAMERELPVAGAVITADGAEAVTNEHGRYQLTLPGIGQAVSAKKDGYLIGRSSRSIVPGQKVYNFLAVAQAELDAQHGRSAHYVDLPEGPKVCIGYYPTALPSSIKWEPQNEECPEGYAWYATDDLFHGDGPEGNEFFRGHCCPLPKNDVLRGAVELHPAICPEHMVVVGVVRSHGAAAVEALRCRAINTERYQLGPSTPGLYFGQGASSRWSGRSLQHAQVPAAIRAGVSRISYEHFDRDGCIGDPPGSLYAGNTKKGRCESHLFRQLRYAGADGDPAAGTPVIMFPDCAYIVDAFDPTTGCR